MSIFGFNTSPSITPTLPQGGYDKKVSKNTTAGPVSGDEMSRLMDALAEQLRTQTALAPQKQALHSNALFGRHLGTGGGEITPENPAGNKANPWASGGLFRGGFGEQLKEPETAITRSQGGSAINQMRDPIHFQGTLPPSEGAAASAMHAGAPTHGNPFVMPQPLTDPMGNATSDAANLAQNMRTYAHGGFVPPATMPRSPIPGSMPPPPTLPGASFGFPSLSPKPGFSF